jgi:hypothetical protein
LEPARGFAVLLELGKARSTMQLTRVVGFSSGVRSPERVLYLSDLALGGPGYASADATGTPSSTSFYRARSAGVTYFIAWARGALHTWASLPAGRAGGVTY